MSLRFFPRIFIRHIYIILFIIILFNEYYPTLHVLKFERKAHHGIPKQDLTALIADCAANRRLEQFVSL